MLGRSGLRVSRIGLGFWQVGSGLWGFSDPGMDTVVALVRAAYEEGIRFFDTAEIYGGGRSEELLGRALRSLGIVDEVVVASKVAGFRTTRYAILKAARGIVSRLGRAPDLLQYHWPPPLHASICRVVRGLEDAVDKGLAHYIGVSNFPKRLLEKALECTRRHEIVSNQVQYSLAYRKPENELKPFMEKHGIALIAWSPLAKGALAGAKASTLAQKRDRVFAMAASDRELQKALEEIAKRYNTSKAVVALAWLVAKNAIPIPGTRKPERVREYAKALHIRLSSNDVNLLSKVSEKYRGKGDYDSLQTLRLIPSPLQALAIMLAGGI